MDKKRSLNKETLRIYWQHGKAYPSLIYTCLIGVIVVILCDIVSPIMYKRFFDLLTETPASNKAGLLGEIYHTLFLIAAVMAVTWTAWRMVMWAISMLECNVMRDTANSSFGHLQKHSTKFFTDMFAGALVKRSNRFTSGFEEIADQFILQLGQTVVRVFLIIGVLYWYNRALGTIFLTWTIALVIFNFLFSKYKLKSDLEKAKADTRVTARLADTIANAINLKLFASTDHEIKSFGKITEEHRRLRYRSWMLGWSYEAIQGVAIRGLEIVMLLVAVKYWLLGTLTIGDLFMLRAYLGQLAEEVRALGKNVRKIYESLADANEMTEIFLKSHEIVNDPHAVVLEVPRGEVEFRSIQFSYQTGTKIVLKDFSLKTKAGEKVGIVGPSGDGKSTVLKILTRLYDVQEGHLLIDHQDIAMVTQESLHRNIAYVPQDPVLFHRSLMENIRYSRPTATDEEVFNASKLAHCHEFITSFPQGYDTLVGERGVKLSGGERQRVAIARAILMDAPILVLDEATSSLDSESELYIQDSLEKLMAGRTVIAVAHRLSTIQKMDRIVVVKEGHIVEEGRHDMLVKVRDGHYQKLWGLQSASHYTVQ